MNLPRILPLVGVAAVGVLAINAFSGARDVQSLVSGAQAFAQSVAKTDLAANKATSAKGIQPAKGDAPATPGTKPGPDPARPKPAPVCAPTAAELAKEAGLSPAELKILQSLGTRRGQLDQREADLNVQISLLAAAEAKLDSKVKTLNGLKSDIQGLLTQGDAKEQAEIDRMVKVYEGMKPKDAAPRLVLLDDTVRIPIAAKMKEKSLSAILAQMPPADAKKLTEGLATRFAAARAAAARNAAAAKLATQDDKSASPKPAGAASKGKSPAKSA